jgi:hypothetical protein
MNRRLLEAIACIAFTSGCSGDGNFPPTAPSRPPVPVPTPASPFAFSSTYTQITVGEVISRHVTTDNPECIEERGWACQYFRITVPTSGTLKIVMTSKRGPSGQGVDLSLADSRGSKWWDPVNAVVEANATYEIAVWYVTAGAEFEFQTSLETK